MIVKSSSVGPMRNGSVNRDYSRVLYDASPQPSIRATAAESRRTGSFPAGREADRQRIPVNSGQDSLPAADPRCRFAARRDGFRWDSLLTTERESVLIRQCRPRLGAGHATRAAGVSSANCLVLSGCSRSAEHSDRMKTRSIPKVVSSDSSRAGNQKQSCGRVNCRVSTTDYSCR